QNFADMRLGNDPRFKFLVSRAVYKGILRYISSQYDSPYVVQPLPVEAFSASFTDAGRTLLRWSPVVDSLEQTAAPDGYIVYTRIGDGGFDNGRRVDVPQLEVDQEPGRIYSYRVTAVNAGGESFPSETLAACRMADERGRVLVVNGFDR
ncbi:MAG TPA: xanthan lyase, partial [Alistipes sp.]|nr:xanthan lyase [Alistipes sp.]